MEWQLTIRQRATWKKRAKYQIPIPDVMLQQAKIASSYKKPVLWKEKNDVHELFYHKGELHLTIWHSFEGFKPYQKKKKENKKVKKDATQRNL